VPFGGRDTMLDRLDHWLENPGGAQRLLLWAPAGRGKSALVVRWLDRLGEHCDIVCLPISIRFGNNRPELLYHALASRLAELLHSEMPAASMDPVSHYRGFAIDFLRRAAEFDRTILIVVDGLDEASGWRFDESLLPHSLPTRLRIVVSARLQAGDTGPSGWQQRLG
jgi:ATP/maltotriose-dependent transcriptional regulator MalT